MRFVISKMFVTIALLMVTDFSFASYCDMVSCGTNVSLDKSSGTICNRHSDSCECATLPSDCYAARRVTHACNGSTGWVRNHGKMIGSNGGSTCCGYKLEANTKCPSVPKDDQPIVRKKDLKNGIFTSEFFAWNDRELVSTNGGRYDSKVAQLDLCIGSHHTNEIKNGTNQDKLELCFKKCANKNSNCRQKISGGKISLCQNVCTCLYQPGECIKK